MQSNNPYDFIPDIDFAPETAETILGRLEDTYENELEKLTGQSEKLPVASREKIILSTIAFELAAISQLFADRAKMNLPKYSRGNYLEVLASFWGLSRREATPAVGVAEFTLSAVREEDIFIPKGTRVSPGEKLFFATDEDLIIRSPATSGRVGITCQQAGSIGNGYAKGKINIIVDPVAYVAQVGNVEKTQGGADVEDDESLRTRIFYAPKGYSVAGPKDSYEFWVREFSQAVEGVGVTSPSAGKVDICLTLTGGEIPEGSYIERLKEYLEDKRPLTDELTIHAPKVVQFDLDITYYINRSDANREIETKAAVEDAVGIIHGGTTVQENWEYGGKPYYFRVAVDAGQEKVVGEGVAIGAGDHLPEIGTANLPGIERKLSPENPVGRLLDTIMEYKNVRSWLQGITVDVIEPGTIHTAALPEVGMSLIVDPYRVKELVTGGTVHPKAIAVAGNYLIIGK